MDETKSKPIPEHEIVQFRDVTKRYGKNEVALDGVNFKLRRGKMTALLGPNGAGKSTTMRIIATLSQPTTGSVIVLGYNLQKEVYALRREIGYVAQKTSIDGFASVRQNLMLQAELYHLSKQETKERIENLLTLFKLHEQANTAAMKLSGGMQRRLDIAMALIHKPKILLMDEPSANLDPDSRMQLWATLAQSIKEHEMTVLFSTHYLEEAEAKAEYILFIDQGKLIAEGTLDELKMKLGGETINIAFINKDRAVEAAVILEKHFAEDNITVVDNRLLITTAEASSQITSITKFLDESHLHTLSLTISKPSLHELYLLLTGESFESVNIEGLNKNKSKQKREVWQ